MPSFALQDSEVASRLARDATCQTVLCGNHDFAIRAVARLVGPFNLFSIAFRPLFPVCREKTVCCGKSSVVGNAAELSLHLPLIQSSLPGRMPHQNRLRALCPNS